MVSSAVWMRKLTITKDMRRKLEATEMWFLRRLLRIPWTAIRSNIEILHMARTERMLMTTLRKRQLGFLGHTLRGGGIEKDCLLGMIEGRRARGRQTSKFMDGIKECIRCDTMREVMRLAEDKAEWRSIVANVNQDTALR